MSEFWQQKPLLIKDAPKDSIPSQNADSLLSVATQSYVDSRIIQFTEGDWKVYDGPFTKGDFFRVDPWTLLINAMDKHNSEVEQLKKLVNFIPTWRFDDIMASYAVKNGSTGPHFDLYDVFLVQSEGNRNWRIGQLCSGNIPMQSHSRLQLLKEFTLSEEYHTEPGDILYIPPNIAHWGISKNTSITYSIGFRSPRLNDMIAFWVDSFLENHSEDILYSDNGLTAAKKPGEIRSEDMIRAQNQVLEAFQTAAISTDWFAELITSQQNQESHESPATIQNWTLVLVNKTSRLAWYQREDKLVFYANGYKSTFSSELLDVITTLCGTKQINISNLPHSIRDETNLFVKFLIDTDAAYVR